MSTLLTAPPRAGRLSRLLTTDFCPGANRFVYWLKEPVGWVALATLVSVMIGTSLSPIGWTLAASLLSIMAVGLIWPWVAVRLVRCHLQPALDHVHEGAPCPLVLSVQNRLPIPVWGLAVEKYIDQHCAGDVPTVSLACVPPLCTADYTVVARPEIRGRYPESQPEVTCSFPFGIWTARRPLANVQSLVVWPKVFPIVGDCPLIGKNNADQGDGQRGGHSGDYVGVRNFRRGDSARHINWVASGRCESLIVTQRGGPQCPEIEIWLDTHPAADPESLSRRIRAAASLLDRLHQTRIDVRVTVGDRSLRYSNDSKGRRLMLDTLAEIPIDGLDCRVAGLSPTRSSGGPRIEISGAIDGSVLIQIDNPLAGRRGGGASRTIRIGRGDDLGNALAGLWKEIADVSVAA